MIEFLLVVTGAKTLAGAIIVIAAVIAAIGGIFALIRKGYRKYRMFRNKVSLAYDSIVGDEAILDPQTGKVLVAARQPIGTRVAVIEEALTSIAESLERMTTIEETLASIVKHQEEHESWSKEWIASHDESTTSDHKKIWDAIESLKPQP